MINEIISIVSAPGKALLIMLTRKLPSTSLLLGSNTKKNEGIPIDLSKFPKLEGILDVVYNPLKTNLVLEAQRLGIKAEGGLYMLVSQAIYAYEHFMGTSVDKSLCDTIFKKILSEKDNIVLTGMPSCGKTTIGKQCLVSEQIESNPLPAFIR